MSNNYFSFKQFTIYHNLCGMKVGTDGVLLGAWANVKNANKILDVGTGTGLISIMLAQRSNAYIEGVEINDLAYKQAVENVSLCPWKNRINIHNISFQTYCANNRSLFDLIVSNPPFFKNSLKPSDKLRTLARHEHGLSHNQLLQGASMLLTVNGKLSVIIPFVEGRSLITEAIKFNLFCIRKTYIKTKPNAPVKRILIEFSKNPAPINEDLLSITNAQNEYSEEYKLLTKKFYLAF